MGWFGGGGDSKKSSSSETNFTSSDADGFSGTSMASDLGGGGGGGAAGAGSGEFAQFSIALQQQMLIQQVVSTLNDVTFNRCITGKPGDSLSGTEVACIHATVGKWLDSNDFMLGRMQKKQQVAQQSMS